MNGNAVVVGGGPGGLLAAHALAGRGWYVTVLERACYPAADCAGPQPRRGAPQSHCLHMLMGAGAQAFDMLVPRWRTALLERGALPFDALRDAAMQLPAGWLPRTASGITMYACSRTLLENVLATELTRYPNARVVQTSKVTGLAFEDDRVIGLRTASDDRLGADLVVDTSGTASRLAQWLAQRDGPESEPVWPETVVPSPWHYASRWFRIPAAQSPDWLCLTAAPSGDRMPAAMMLRAEDDFWNVVLLSRDGTSIPDSDNGFLAFTAPLAEGRFNKALQGAVPASPIHHYGRTTNRVRRMETVTDWPKGLAALGDSVMTLDPYFGLGMTNAARGAVLLAEHLDRDRQDAFNGAAFQTDLARRNRAAWQLATGQDETGRPLPPDGTGLVQAYAAAPDDPDLARAVLEVQHLLRPADSLRKGKAA